MDSPPSSPKKSRVPFEDENKITIVPYKNKYLQIFKGNSYYLLDRYKYDQNAIMMLLDLNKINKLGDTVYKLDKLDTVMDDNIFIPISEINELRREGINKLNSLRLYSTNYKRENYYIDVPDYKREKLVTCLLDKIDKLDRQYDIVYSYQDNDNTIKKIFNIVSHLFLY